MKMRVIAVMAFLSIAACGQVSEGASDSSTSTQPLVESTTTTTPPESTTTTSTDESDGQPTPPGDPRYPESEVTDDLLDAIVADAAERTSVDPDEVEIISMTEETFNDSSLGCPEPGQVYTQVITPGHIVIVQGGGAELDYRVGAQPKTFKLCEE